MERPYRRRSFLGPILLIAFGVIFLLNNLGVLNWNVWATLIRLWPVLLIGFGLDLLIGRRSVVGSVIVVLLVLIVVAVAVWGFTAQPVVGGEALTSEEINQPLDGASRADVQITLPHVVVQPFAEPPQGDVRTTRAGAPSAPISRSGRQISP